MTQEILSSCSATGNPNIVPEQIYNAFRNLVACEQNSGYRVTLEQSYRRSMLERRGREFRQKEFLLATFVRNVLDVIEIQYKHEPNTQAIEEILACLDEHEILSVFDDDTLKSISHVDLSISLEKRFQLKGTGKNAIQRIDYLLSYNRKLRLGGEPSEIGRHTIISHIGCNYRDHYATEEKYNKTFINHFQHVLEQAE